jgi:hypothetical protein
MRAIKSVGRPSPIPTPRAILSLVEYFPVPFIVDTGGWVDDDVAAALRVGTWLDFDTELTVCGVGVLLVNSNTELVVCCTGVIVCGTSFVVSVGGRLEVLIPADVDWIGTPTHLQNATMCDNVSGIGVQFRRHQRSNFRK